MGQFNQQKYIYSLQPDNGGSLYFVGCLRRVNRVTGGSSLPQMGLGETHVRVLAGIRGTNHYAMIASV